MLYNQGVNIFWHSGGGQYNGLIVETAKQMRDFADFYEFEFRA